MALVEDNYTALECSICPLVLFAELVAPAAVAEIDHRIAVIVAGIDCIAVPAAAGSASGILWDQRKSAEARKGLWIAAAAAEAVRGIAVAGRLAVEMFPLVGNMAEETPLNSRY